MSVISRPPSARHNRLLAALPDADYARLASHLDGVDLPVGHVLSTPGAPISDVYFLTDAVASFVMPLPDRDEVEVATVGREGMIGLPLFLGAETSPLACFIQVPGVGFRLGAETFAAQVVASRPLHDLLQRSAQALMVQVAQSMTCNQAHALEQRCARWLLMTRDRTGSDTFQLTQEFLGRMLCVRRPRASKVASAVQRADLIRYSRGQITIVDGPGLEAASCACYRIIVREQDRLLGSVRNGNNGVSC